MVHTFERDEENFNVSGYYDNAFECPFKDTCQYVKNHNECSVFKEFKESNQTKLQGK